jgi:hypothetical protein
VSQDNVELARQVLYAINGRDLSRLIELTDPKIEWHSFFAELGEGGVYRGHDGLRRYIGTSTMRGRPRAALPAA